MLLKASMVLWFEHVFEIIKCKRRTIYARMDA